MVTATARSSTMPSALSTRNVDPRSSAYVGLVWNVDGSKNNKYDVELTPYGFKCNCMGFTMRKFCKHVDHIDWLVGGDHEDPVYKIPNV
jgi:hypothetical protein